MAAGDGPGRVGAEQRERVLATQLVPHLFDLDRGLDKGGVPEQGDHLAEHENRLPSMGRLPERRADLLPETSGLRAVADHEAGYRLVGVELQIGAPLAGRRHVDAHVGQVLREGTAVIRRGDNDRRAATVRNGWEKMLAHAGGELLLILVEQDDVLAA